VSFESFQFHPHITAGIVVAGYQTPTPIQSQTIQPVLDGRDVMGLAQTGTGKTAAFVLPILQHLLKGPRGKLRVLILSPTRELAEQTHTVIDQLGHQTRLRSITERHPIRSRNCRCLPWTAARFNEPKSNRFEHG
jgi:ATP-dependent RNA helicase RhlE